MHWFSIRYNSTNCYLLDTGHGLLAFDAGWPNTYREYKDCLKEKGYKIKDIHWVLVSHFHIDHAGLVGHFLTNGITGYVFPNQLEAIDEMEALIERKSLPYHKIDKSKITVISLADSRALLSSLGIKGEVIQTNGHGEQSVTLILDEGETFIGDLPPDLPGGYDHLVTENWKQLKARGAKHIKPAHAPEYELEA